MDKKKLNETLVLAYQNHQKNNLDIAQNLYEKTIPISNYSHNTIHYFKFVGHVSSIQLCPEN